MLPIATEVFTITEQRAGSYVSILNDQFFAEHDVRNPNSYLKAMLTLGRDRILKEIARTDRARTVDTAVHRSFRDTVFSASFLLDEHMELILLTYFGEKTPTDTNYAEALVHVLEVLDILENDLNGIEARTQGRNVASAAIALPKRSES